MVYNTHCFWNLKHNNRQNKYWIVEDKIDNTIKINTRDVEKHHSSISRVSLTNAAHISGLQFALRKNYDVRMMQ